MDSEFAESIGATTNVINDMEALVNRLKDKDIYTIAELLHLKIPFAESRHDLAIKIGMVLFIGILMVNAGLILIFMVWNI